MLNSKYTPSTKKALQILPELTPLIALVLVTPFPGPIRPIWQPNFDANLEANVSLRAQSNDGSEERRNAAYAEEIKCWIQSNPHPFQQAVQVLPAGAPGHVDDDDGPAKQGSESHLRTGTLLSGRSQHGRISRVILYRRRRHGTGVYRAHSSEAGVIVASDETRRTVG
jgi:hypothetical protein